MIHTTDAEQVLLSGYENRIPVLVDVDVAAAGVNLVQNATFQDWNGDDPVGWEHDLLSPSSGSVFVVTDEHPYFDPLVGDRALVVSNEYASPRTVWQTVPVTAAGGFDVTYRVVVWAKIGSRYRVGVKRPGYTTRSYSDWAESDETSVLYSREWRRLEYEVSGDRGGDSMEVALQVEPASNGPNVVFGAVWLSTGFPATDPPESPEDWEPEE